MLSMTNIEKVFLIILTPPPPSWTRTKKWAGSYWSTSTKLQCTEVMKASRYEYMLSHHHTLTGNPLTCKIILNIYCCLFNFLFLVEQIKTTPRIIVKTVLNLFIIFFKYSNSKKNTSIPPGFSLLMSKDVFPFPRNLEICLNSLHKKRCFVFIFFRPSCTCRGV